MTSLTSYEWLDEITVFSGRGVEEVSRECPLDRWKWIIHALVAFPRISDKRRFHIEMLSEDELGRNFPEMTSLIRIFC